MKASSVPVLESGVTNGVKRSKVLVEALRAVLFHHGLFEVLAAR